MFGMIFELVTTCIQGIDKSLEETPAHQIIMATAAVYFVVSQYSNISQRISQAYRTRHNKTLQQRIIDMTYDLAKNLPPVKKYLANELDKNLASTKEKLTAQRAQMLLQEQMPETGTPIPEILKEFGVDAQKCNFKFAVVTEESEERQFTVQKNDGQDSGALYAVYPTELTELLKEVYGQTALTNPMHEKWPRINAMQAEIIQWSQKLFGGSEDNYGVITHGGTTSIIEAMIAYVIYARSKGIVYPEIVVPETAHAAFKKAADLTGAVLITVPVDKTTGAVNAKEMSRYISKNTAVIVGSAPSFMNGINDPIGDLGQLALNKNIPFHVDACLGGFLTAFTDTSDAPMDFRVPGVTSISADFHKYGCCPKGTSVCLFSKDSPALPVYSALNWSGGLYATAGTLDGSTSGARVAEIYATLSYYGHKKYREITERILHLRQSLQERIVQLNQNEEVVKKDIYVYGNPKWSVLGFRSETLNPHLIADELDKRGWKLSLLQNPAGFHLCLTHVHTLVKDFESKFMQDLVDAIASVKAYPKDRKPTGNVKVYGAIGMMPTKIQEQICTLYQKARLFFHGSPKAEEKIEVKNAQTAEAMTIK